MIVDFHTHIFPDKVARGAVASLASAANLPAYTDGTAAGLRAALKRAGVTVGVNLPVLTAPRQFEGVLRFATELNAAFRGEGILSFAGVHPAQENIAAAMRAVREAGIRGVKIHPEYQDTFIDDEASYRLLAAAKSEGLIVVTHAGVDAAYRDRAVRCTPERVARVLDRLGGFPELLLAHLGGAEMYGEVMAHLAGREVYFDTAFVLPDTSREQLLALIGRHGAERILFATDSPWQDIAAEVARMRALALPTEDEARILYKNAAALLGLSGTAS